MSVNYHAAQSRGVLLKQHEKAGEQWQKTFTDYDPERIQRILQLKSDAEYLYLDYFQKPYRLCLKDGHLEKKEEQVWQPELYFNEAMVIYHFLYYTKDMPVISHSWISSQVVDGMVTRRAMADPLLDPFAKCYTGQLEKLKAACEAAGGIPVHIGDVGYEFEAFPQVHLRLIFWEAEEDYPAQVQVQVDRCILDFVHYETVGCMIADLFDLLEGEDR